MDLWAVMALDVSKTLSHPRDSIWASDNLAERQSDYLEHQSL